MVDGMKFMDGLKKKKKEKNEFHKFSSKKDEDQSR